MFIRSLKQKVWIIGLSLGVVTVFHFANFVPVPGSINFITASPAYAVSNQSASVDKNVAPDFELLDQNGQKRRLSDYRGKVVFLNFWATWCPPCRREMPDIQALYESHGKNLNDVVVLAVANPKSIEYPQAQDVPLLEVKKFLNKNHFTYPVVMDMTGEVFGKYQIEVFPTTFMIDKNGAAFGYIRGSLTTDVMNRMVQQTLAGKR